MRPTPVPMTEQQAVARRRSVRRTALVVACVAIAIYAGFIAMGLLSHGAAR